jgi:LuxR family transcriptional regulator, quorum-sensing system regulator BjaR1
MTQTVVSAAALLGEAMVANPVFRFAETAQTATDMATIDNELAVLLSGFGIQHFVLYQATDRSGRAVGGRLCGRRNQDWLKHYVGNNLAARDDLMCSGANSITPTTWSGTGSSRQVSPGQQQIFDEASEFGLLDGFYLPIHQPDGSMYGVSMMVRRKFDNEPRMLAALQLLAIYYSVAAQRLGISPLTSPPSTDQPKAILTPRQLECLKWSRAGKSSWETSVILGLSEHTINEHLAEARKRLGARTTNQAVIESIARGLMPL